jgi:Tfp pilus assembly protein PilO
VTSRDRIAALVVGAVVLLAGFWFLALSPKRKDAKALNDQIAQAQQRLDTARQKTAAAAAARDRYDADYATVAKLGKAVPADDDVPSLVYQLDHVSKRVDIDFRSVKLNPAAAAPAAAPPVAQAAAVNQASGSSTDSSSSSSSGTSTTPSSTSGSQPATSAPATQTAAAGLPPGSSVGSAGFPTMPFSFVFDGSFFDMESFFSGVQRLADTRGPGLTVRGRLLTVDSFALSASRSGFPKVKAEINSTAYLVPGDEGVTGGATPQGPATATPASGSAPSSTPTAPAAATSITGGAR